ncbi:WUSCHEL-related homeobox 8 [Acorus calamus]|uniref:WUSCHEL-related homeobox 8 n=1 Tax=Acorus calamus TaxID=4465 RepID=A0AAV9CDT2_ACOCL|nr:WUSCHEL-related homeobox 8 [Acorus calamus]
MVNPPRDEIRRIRTRLQEYGQVGDANVFYWFQNRKSRSKHKNRHLLTTTNNRSHSRQTTSAATSSSSSTSSDKSSPDKHPLLPSAAIDVPTNSPTASVNHTNLEQLSAVIEPPFLLQGTAASHGGGYYFSPDYLSNLVQIPEHGLGLCPGLLTELISQGQVGSEKEELKMEVVHPGYPVIANASSVVPTTTTTTTTSTTALSDLQGGGVGEMGGHRVMVFINDVAFEIGVGPINLREAFGDGAVLLHSSGHPVLTDHLGLTIQPLQHGASYYLTNI